jgi:hypothetical protein
MEVLVATIELTRFRIKPEREQDLVHARDGMIADFVSDRDGFLGASLVRLGAGEWLDVVIWSAPSDFAASREKGANHPGIGAFFAAIAELVSMEEGEIVHSYGRQT